MNEAAPFDYRPDLANQVQPLLRELLGAAVEWVRT
jgi:N-formylglutamate deformylase